VARRLLEQADRALPVGQLPPGRKWGSTASITTAPDGTIWVVDRCGNSGAGGTTCGGASATVHPVFQFEPSGKLLRNFGAGVFVSPHKLTVDAGGNLWLADNGSHQVFKMAPDGKVLMTLGKKGVAGDNTSRDLFNQPNHVALAPNGDIYVSDGYVNARVVHFSKAGQFVRIIGGVKGSQPGQLQLPHGVALDSKGRILVNDSDNQRVSVFDKEGSFVEAWPYPSRGGIAVAADDTVYISDVNVDVLNQWLRRRLATK